MMSVTVERIANLASLLEDQLQEKLWEYAELLYVEQVAFENTESVRTPAFDAAIAAALYGEGTPPDTLVSGFER